MQKLSWLMLSWGVSSPCLFYSASWIALDAWWSHVLSLAGFIVSFWVWVPCQLLSDEWKYCMKVNRICVLNYICFIVISKAWSGKASHNSISQTLFSMEHEGRLQEQIYFKNKIKWKCTESIRMKRKASGWLSHQTNTICMLHWARQEYVTVCCLHYCRYMCRKVSEPEDEINKPRCSGIPCLEGCLVAWILFYTMLVCKLHYAQECVCVCTCMGLVLQTKSVCTLVLNV